MRILILIISILLFSTNLINAQIPLGDLSTIHIISTESWHDCGSMEFVPFTPIFINFGVIPDEGAEVQGARFRVTYEGPEEYFWSMGTSYYNEELVSSFECTDIFEGVDVILSQCISEPTIIFSHDFMVGTGAYEVVLRLAEHTSGGLGVYNCDTQPILQQVCTFDFLINNDDYQYGCYYDCPTVANEESTWGVIKSMYTD